MDMKVLTLLFDHNFFARGLKRSTYTLTQTNFSTMYHSLQLSINKSNKKNLGGPNLWATTSSQTNKKKKNVNY